MRLPSRASNIVNLKNGCQIKGTYSMSLGGMHVTVYLVSATGILLSNRNYSFKGGPQVGQDRMMSLIGALEQLCLRSKFDQISQPRVQEAAARALTRVLTKEAVFKLAA